MIAGGQSNSISSTFGSIIGGYQNTIPASCNYTSILGGANITAAQNYTAYAQRLTTRGGRQKKITRLTASATLGLDDHFVVLYSSTSTALTATLPLAPVDGQEYNIKCMLSTGIVTVSGNGKNIQSTANIALYASYTMLKGQAAHMIYSAADGVWCMMT